MAGPAPAQAPAVHPGARTWRLLPLEPGRGAWHMAFDEAMLWAHARGLVPPTLRFYTWEPPAVSVGYFQDPAAGLDLEACRARGLDVVRRPTGGRAVLHHRELTYAVVIRQAWLPGSVVDTYRALAAGLLEGLRSLGVAAALEGPAAPAYQASPACFAVPTWHELVVGGKKVAGSAQVRRDGALLQHGAILLEFDPAAQAAVLRWPPGPTSGGCADPAAAADLLARRATGLSAAAGRPLGAAEVARAVAGGFERALGVRLVPGKPHPEELRQARALAAGKYAAAAGPDPGVVGAPVGGPAVTGAER